MSSNVLISVNDGVSSNLVKTSLISANSVTYYDTTELQKIHVAILRTR